MNRNPIEEIKLLKGRSEFRSRLDFSERLNGIRNVVSEAYTKKDIVSDELLKYVPIASVACIEAFFRSAVREMIDFGPPFSENAEKFNQSKNVKFDFSVVKAVQNKLVSIGEFVSHLLPCNNLDNINSNLSILIGDDFVTRLKSFTPKSQFEQKTTISKHFIENCGEVLDDIKRTFELRHIFCHEFGLTVKIDRDLISRYFDNVQVFLNHSNFFIWDVLYPDAPETQSEMNIKAGNDFQRTEQELEKLIQVIISNPEIEASIKPLFLESIAKWKEYREAKATADADFVKGGTMYPLIFATSKSQLTTEKIESLYRDHMYYIERS